MWTEQELWNEAKYRIEFRIACTEDEHREPTNEEIEDLLNDLYENGEW